jgi:hypothetical protein
VPDCLLTDIPMRPERDDWAKIWVQMTGRGAGKPGFQGIVRIDGVQSLDLVGGMPSVFRVEPGEHKVSVRFRRRFRFLAVTGSRLAVMFWVTMATSILVSSLIHFRRPYRSQGGSYRIEDPYFLEREDTKCQKACLWKPETELCV